MKSLPHAKKKKLRKMSALKKDAWKVFSELVRREVADQFGMNRCVTCLQRVFWKELHAGHFIHGHSKATFMDERNVHPQCRRCNHFLSGNLLEYVEYMRKRYGQETIDELKELSHKIWNPTRQQLEDLKVKYESKLKDLE